jgi:hypothetical protein
MTLTFLFLLHDYPLALGSGLDGVNINHRMADGQRNTLQIPNAAEVISKDAETHIVAPHGKIGFLSNPWCPSNFRAEESV